MNTEFQKIIDTVNYYFQGTYHGDETQLRKAFHPDVRITGIINDEYYDWGLSDFILRVTAQPTAASKGEEYSKEIIMLDVTKHIAMVKARVIVSDLIFTDYITLLKLNNSWIIRNKSFTSYAR